MKHFSLFAAALPLFAMPAAFAAPLQAASKITQVTVYPGRASVTREADVVLPAGTSEVVFSGLPQGIDSQALQIGIAGAKGVSLGEVDVTPSAASRNVPPNPMAQRIKKLADERAAQQVVIDTLRAKRGMMLHFAATSPAKLTLDGKPLDIDQWSKAFDSLEAALAKTSDELRVAKAKQADIDAALASLRSTPPPSPVQRSRDISLAVTSASAITAHVTLTYQVMGAGWTPVYEARLSMGSDPKTADVNLIRRAEVRQSTGEPWNNVKLTLSNSTIGYRTKAPDVTTQLVDILPKAPPPRPVLQTMSKFAAAPMVDARQAAQVTHHGIDVAFKVPGTVSLGGQGVQAQFELTNTKAAAALRLKIAPAFSQMAFVDAILANDPKIALLPGPVSLYRNGLFVGKAYVPLTAPGARLDLGFGADPGIKVARHTVNLDKAGPGFISSSRTQTWDYSTEITNTHDFPVEVEVVDRVPVSQNNDVSVKLLPQTSPGTAKPRPGQRGLMFWNFTLKPQEVRTLRLAWQVQWPDGRQLGYHAAGPRPLN